MSDLGGRNFHVTTIGLNLTFIGEEIYTLSFTKQFGRFNRIETMQLNIFTTHPIFGTNEPLDFELICICLSTALFKQINMGSFVI